MYDFSKVAPATAGNYLDPGIYKVKVKEAKAVESKKNNTPGIAVTFITKEEETVTETFYVTEETTGRLQYLHNAWLGKNLEGTFKSESEVVAYFVNSLNGAKKTVKTVLVGGKIGENGRVFSGLPYSGFVIEEGDVELGAFDPDSKDYKKYVTVSNLKNEVAGKKNGILNDDEEEEEGEEEIGSKKKTDKKAETTGKAAKSSSKTSSKKPAKKDEDETEDPDEENEEEAKDDLDW